MKRTACFLLIFTGLALVAACIFDSTPKKKARNSPKDGLGTAWFPPVVEIMSDTVVSINDELIITAEAWDSSGKVVLFYWAWDSLVFTDSTENGEWQRTCRDTGIFTAYVRVHDDDGLYSDTDSLIVGVLANPPSVTGMKDTSVSINDSLKITAVGSDSNGTVEKYYWALDGDQFTDSSSTGSFKTAYTISGEHFVLVKVRDNDAMFSASDSILVSVKLYRPSVTIMKDTIISINDSLTITAEASDTNGSVEKYYWSFDSTEFIDITLEGEITRYFPDTGLHLIRVQVSDDDTIFSLIDEMTVNVITAPPVINTMPDISVDINDTILLTADCMDGFGFITGYFWALDGNAFSDTTDTNSINYAFPDSGAHAVLVQCRDDDGNASAVDSIWVFVGAHPPQVSIMADTIISINDSLDITALGADENGEIIGYFWSTDSGQSYPFATDTGLLSQVFEDTGVHVIQVIAVDDDSMRSGPALMGVRVLANPPRIDSVWNAETLVNDSVVLKAFASDSNGTVEKYLWAVNGSDFNDSTDSGTLKIMYPQPGVYQIPVKVRDNDGVYSFTETLTITIYSLYLEVQDGSAVTANSISLQWNISNTVDFVSYQIRFSIDSEVTPANSLVADIDNRTSVSYDWTGLVDNTVFYIRLFELTSSDTIGYNTIRVRTLSSNASLSGLEISAGTLAPEFNSEVTTYNVAVINTISAIKVVPTAKHQGSEIMVNGTATMSGDSSQSIPLPVGTTTVTINLTAEDGLTTRAYDVAITRVPSVIAGLSDLTISDGELYPSFSEGVPSYNVIVTQDVSSITLTPIKSNDEAVITVDGTEVASGSASGAVSLDPGINMISIVVTAGDTNYSNMYIIRVMRYLSFTDPRDSRVYSKITIGSQTWMAENLNHDITGSSWCYDDNPDSCETFGRLYTWQTAVNACPDGWRLPNDEDWKMLERYIGMEQAASDETGWRGTIEGTKLKSLSGWNNDGNGTDAYAWTGLPAGYRYNNGVYYDRSVETRLWTAEDSGGLGWSRALNTGRTGINRTAEEKSQGMSVRCMLSNDASLSQLLITNATLNPDFDPGNYSYIDTVANSVPSVVITPQLNYSMAMVTVNGVPVQSNNPSDSIGLNDGQNEIAVTVTAEDGETTQTYTITIFRIGNPDLSGISLSAGSLIPAFHPDTTNYSVELGEVNPSISITPTSASTTAVIKINGANVSSGSASGPHNLDPGATAFTIQVSAEVGVAKEYTVTAYRGFYDLRDSTFYNVTVIGTQTWMAENLNFDPVTGSSWCYENDTTNCNVYGRLYSWTTAVNDNFGNGEDICPSGWHLPTDAEWKTLELEAGMDSSELDKTPYRGVDEATKLKSSTKWNGTDDYKFNAIPSGYINNTGVGFFGLGTYAQFWTSSLFETQYAWIRTLNTDEVQIGRSNTFHVHGFSVRCVLGVLNNHAPVYGSTVASMTPTGIVGLLYSDTVHATDPDDDNLNFTLITKPSTMTINDSIINWIPNDAQKGVNNVSIQVADGNGRYDTLSWSITVSSLTDGLIAYYPFNGNANDESGQANNGTVNGATLTTDRFGSADKAYNFDGVDDFISIGDSPDWDAPYKSICAWARPTTDQKNMKLLFREGYTEDSGFELVYGGQYGGSFYSGGWKLAYAAGQHNEWSHVVAINNGSNVLLYVNGVLTTGESCGPSVAGSGILYIGQHIGGGYRWEGYIDEIRIYNRVLTDAEIQLLSNER
ncbi:FISUMP domain-containing protein [Fibrobacterota bacterium]